MKEKILLIMPQFFSYHLEVISELEKLNFEVVYIPEVNNSFLYRTSKKISSKFFSFLKSNHQDKILNLCKNNDLHKILLIRGELFDIGLINEIKFLQPNVKLIMYQWDSYHHIDYRNVIKDFNIVKTFDRRDAKELKIDYLPLFYSDLYKVDRVVDKQIQWDLFFCGSFHSDRLNIIKFFLDESLKNNIKFKFHLYIPFLSYCSQLVRRNLRISDLRYLSFYKLDHSHIADIYQKTKCVLDVELDIQSGLSIRTLESLASKCDLITTNRNILNECFYDKENIFIIDRNNLCFPKDFIENERGFSCDVKQYSIYNWLRELLKQ